jgi:hypothetical protein
MKTHNIIKSSCFAAVMAAAALTIGCQPDEVKSGNALSNDDIDASFTVSQIDGNANKLRLTGTTEATNNIWDFGNGEVRASRYMTFSFRMQVYIPLQSYRFRWLY